MKIKPRITVFFSILILIAFVSTACLAIGAPKTKTLNFNLDEISNVVARNQKEVPPQWILGIIIQEWYTKSYGLDSDEHNKVNFRVYLTNGTVGLIPCSPRQEKHFIELYEPGDVIAMKIDQTASRVSGMQSVVRLCLYDVMMIEKQAISFVGPELK